MENGIFGGKRKALTFSFDDGVLEDVRVIEILNKYGLKGTFNLNSGLLTQTAFWFYREKCVRHINYLDSVNLYDGHEIASHSYTHPYPDMLDYSHNDIANQVKLDKKILECIYGRKVQGFAYPMGTYNDDMIGILKESGFRYARTIHETNRFDLPENLLLWDPTCHFLDDHVEALFRQFSETEETAVFYIWGHSYELTSDADFEKFDRLCASLAHHDEVAYLTNIEIINAISPARSADRVRSMQKGL